MPSRILLLPTLLLAACDFQDNSVPFDPGDCGATREACAPSCAHLGDPSAFVDARCEGGRQICPAGMVKVSSCDD